VNGALIHTVSSESTVVEDVLNTIEATGMKGMENINYQEAIKRILGWKREVIT
jgi:hypothetical protein